MKFPARAADMTVEQRAEFDRQALVDMEAAEFATDEEAAAMLAYTAPPAAQLAAADAWLANWAEDMHPRGEGGRFTTKDDEEPEPEASMGAIRPGSLSTSFQMDGEALRDRMLAEGDRRIAAAVERGVFTHPVTGTRLDKPLEPKAIWKTAAANAVQARMTSSTEDMVRAMGVARVTQGISDKGPGGFYWTPKGWEAMPRAIDMGPGRPVVGPDNPEFDRITREWAASAMIHEWASSSNDTNQDMLAMQEVAAREFGLTGTHDWRMSDALREGIDYRVEQHGAVYADFLRAQYAETQEMFRDMGVSTLPLYRGMDVDPTFAARMLPAEFDREQFDLRPMSSFTTSYGVASNFGWAGDPDGVAVTIAGYVPVERVLSTPATGFGCLKEAELTVLGGGQTEFAGEHRNTQSDAALAVSGAVKDQVEMPDNWSVRDAQKVEMQPGGPPETPTYTVAVNDSFTGYTRTFDVEVKADGTVTPVGEVPRMWTAEERQTQAEEMLATATLPQGWSTKVETENVGTSARVVVADANGNVAIATPYFTVDSGGGVTEAGAQRLADTAVATYAAESVAGARWPDAVDAARPGYTPPDTSTLEAGPAGIPLSTSSDPRMGGTAETEAYVTTESGAQVDVLTRVAVAEGEMTVHVQATARPSIDEVNAGMPATSTRWEGEASVPMEQVLENPARAITTTGKAAVEAMEQTK